MITLITGAPGAGKTLLAIDEFLRVAEKEGRKIVVDGIPELLIDHDPAVPLSDWTKTVEDSSSQDGEKLLFTFPQGALVVIDEAQRVYRPRAVGSVVPPYVAAFETHRHQGLDFLLLTQHANLIDSNVRKLVGRHLHIRDIGLLGRKVYEWPEASNVERFRDAPIQRGYSLAKDSYRLYKSSSLHVKPKRGIPKGMLLLAVLVPLIIGGAYSVYSSISKKLEKPAAVVPVVSGGVGIPTVAEVAPVANAVSTLDLLMEFNPRVSGRPETAPAYDALRVVKNLPVVAGCVQLSKSCTCQTQQGTDAGLSALQCRAWLDNPPFDAYRENVVTALSAPGGKAALPTAAGAGAPSARLDGQPVAAPPVSI